MATQVDGDERAYFMARAREERQAAANAPDGPAGLAHQQMAAEYERRAAELGAVVPAPGFLRQSRR